MKGILFNPDYLIRLDGEFENIQRLRGWIVDCFARSDYLIADFGLRCVKEAELYDNSPSFPGDFKRRVKKIEEILKNSSFENANCIITVLSDFLEDYDARNFLCHGFVVGVRNPGSSPSYRLLKWTRDSGDYSRVERDFTKDQMFAIADRLGLASEKLFNVLRSEYEIRGWTPGSIFDS